MPRECELGYYHCHGNVSKGCNDVLGMEVKRNTYLLTIQA